MNAPVLVKHLVQADEFKTQWLNNMLAESVESSRFERVPGVRIIPLSKYAGRLDRLNYEWSIDLCISSGFWRKDGLISTYLPECAHLLVSQEEHRRGERTHVHGPIFFLINMVLFDRLDAARKTPGDMLGCLKLYDFQDEPIDWPEPKFRSAVLEFALTHYLRLAQSDLSAEAVAREAWDLWKVERENLVIREKEKAQEAEEKKSLKNECESLKAKVIELERQREISFGWRFIFTTGWSGVFFLGFIALGLYTSAVVAVVRGLAVHRLL
jgi:hypothetical protein